ncbi:histidine phosphatase family protein [Candidatus Entotheonella palauensis]|uniref:histidine phosphatase family protein n=1 Tax=Candidatus Entotheonella palauensis TaxID=93172 RepID=UPI000B802977|nr:histidine phosphatase family protein [Candidatus Entotheonella palauensis]
MIRMTYILLALLFALVSLRGEVLANSDTTDLWPRLAQGGVAVLIRHALAPGFSDPPTFKLGDCSTQRNLSDTGRRQARQIGAMFRQRGVTIGNVYTSQWCRCRDTAELLELGPVTPLPLLNSFFETREREQEQTEALARFLKTTPISHVIVLVTHQVNISALTGVYPASGEAVVVEAETSNALRVLGPLSFSLK